MATAGKDARVIQLTMTLAYARDIAEHEYKRLSQYEAETKLPGFAIAAPAYARVLWNWVIDESPQELVIRMNKALETAPPKSLHFLTAMNSRYLIRRAIYIGGLQHGDKAHEPDQKWHRDYLELQTEANWLNDVALFQEAMRARQKPRRKEAAGERLTRFYLLLAWLAGGLWNLDSDGDRAQWLNRAHAKAVATESGVEKAIQRLGLRPTKRM